MVGLGTTMSMAGGDGRGFAAAMRQRLARTLPVLVACSGSIRVGALYCNDAASFR